MFYIYGAENSRATEKTENLLVVCKRRYKLFLLHRDYTIKQLQRLQPETTVIPHIYDDVKYVGGLKELYDYLYTVIKFEDEGK